MNEKLILENQACSFWLVEQKNELVKFAYDLVLILSIPRCFYRTLLKALATSHGAIKELKQKNKKKVEREILVIVNLIYSRVYKANMGNINISKSLPYWGNTYTRITFIS